MDLYVIDNDEKVDVQEDNLVGAIANTQPLWLYSQNLA